MVALATTHATRGFHALPGHRSSSPLGSQLTAALQLLLSLRTHRFFRPFGVREVPSQTWKRGGLQSLPSASLTCETNSERPEAVSVSMLAVEVLAGVGCSKFQMDRGINTRSTVYCGSGRKAGRTASGNRSNRSRRRQHRSDLANDIANAFKIKRQSASQSVTLKCIVS